MRNKYSRFLVSFIIIFVVIFLSIGYSAFDESLLIDSASLNVRVKEDIRITNITVLNTSDATSHYEDYNVKNITSGITLPNSNSSITYEIEVTNYGNVEMGIISIDNLPDSLEYELVDYKLKDRLCDNDGTCKLGSKTKFYLTIKYKDNKYDSKNVDFDFSLEFVFKRVYSITYKNFDSVLEYPSYVIEGDDLKINFYEAYPSMLNISMNGVSLVSGANYEYYNYILTLNDVFGDIHIVCIEGREFIDTGVYFVNLDKINYNDDNYLFAGDIYYLNPYDLTIKCDSSNFVEDASSNPNQCMKWYQISEDDEYVTLILNSNLGEAVDDAEDITSEANIYMKTFTDNWDDKLLLFNGLVIDGYDYTDHKARMITMDELSAIVEHPNWSSDNFTVSTTNIKNYYNFLYENINMDSWKEAGYFTSTKHSSTLNYVFNKGGLDASVSDGYTHGVRPVIVVKKDDLDLGREKIFSNKDVTYLNSSMVSSVTNSSISSLEFHIKNMRAAGIRKAYLNVGHLELVVENDTIVLENTISDFISDYGNTIARMMKIGKDYGVEIIPWLNFPMDLDYIETIYDGDTTWGDYVIDEFKVIVEDILKNGFYCSDDGEVYYPKEIHLDAEPMNKKYQDYYLKLIKGFDSIIGNRANFSVASPAIDYFSTEYIQTLSEYVNFFNIMIYDSNGLESGSNKTQTKDEYLDYVKTTINNYSTALNGYETRFYALGAMYENLFTTTTGEGWPDSSSGIIYKHMNVLEGEELETIGNLVEAIVDLNDSNLDGIGIYNWEGFSSYNSSYNKGSYITDEYNYITVRKNFLREWAYK